MHWYLVLLLIVAYGRRAGRCMVSCSRTLQQSTWMLMAMGIKPVTHTGGLNAQFQIVAHFRFLWITVHIDSMMHIQNHYELTAMLKILVCRLTGTNPICLQCISVTVCAFELQIPGFVSFFYVLSSVLTLLSQSCLGGKKKKNLQIVSVQWRKICLLSQQRWHIQIWGFKFKLHVGRAPWDPSLSHIPRRQNMLFHAAYCCSYRSVSHEAPHFQPQCE